MLPQSLDLQHRTLDRLLADVEFFAQKRDFAHAVPRFSEFRRALLAHLDEEEKHDPFARVPRIRAQHAELAAMLDTLEGALAGEDYATFCTQLDLFVRQLQEHQKTEEGLHRS
jgi:heme oxygenase